MQLKQGGSPGERRARPGRWAVEILALLALFILLHLWTTRHAAEGTAPELRGTLLDGRYFDLREHEARPVLVYFWATWCPVCRVSEGAIEAISREWPVVAVAMQSGGAGEVRSFMQERGIDFPVLIDQDGQSAARWGVNGVPTSFVVDASGTIRFVETGYTSGPGLRLRLRMASL